MSEKKASDFDTGLPPSSPEGNWGRTKTPYTVDDIELFRKVLSAEVKEDVLSWFKGQLWIAGIIVAAIGFLGATPILRTVYDDEVSSFRSTAQEVISQAGIAAGRATQASEDARQSSLDLKSELSALKNQIDVTTQEVSDLKLQTESIKSAANSYTSRNVAELIARIEGVEGQLTEVARGVSQAVADIDAEQVSQRIAERALETSKSIANINQKANVSASILTCNQITHINILCNQNSTSVQRISEAGYKSTGISKVNVGSSSDEFSYLRTVLLANRGGKIISYDPALIDIDFLRAFENDLGFEDAVHVAKSDLPEIKSDIVVLLP